MLKQHVVAESIHEGAEALGLTDTALAAQGGEDAHEGFLAHILNGLRRMQAGTQLDLD